MKITLNTVFLLILIVSPLLSLTGENQFSTGLNLASLLNLPSLNSFNYLFLLLVFFIFIYLNAAKSYTNLIITIVCFICLLVFLPRHFSFFSFVGIITILSTFLVFMKDKSGFTTLSDGSCRLLFKIYAIYILLSVIAHFGILLAASNYYANDRMMGIFKNPNQFGFFLVSFNIFYLIKIRQSDSKSFFLFLFITVLIVMTGSRSALVTHMLIHFADQFIRRRWIYLLAIFFFGVVAGLFIQYINTDKAIAFISRRQASAIRTVGDMRMQIFLDTWKESSTEELFVGKDASIGTGGFIFEQRFNNGSVVWLDSLINVLFYNWGLFGLGLFIFLAITDLSTQFPILTRHVFVIVLYIISSYFFVIGDFFPLPFLLIFFKNNLDE